MPTFLKQFLLFLRQLFVKEKKPYVFPNDSWDYGDEQWWEDNPEEAFAPEPEEETPDEDHFADAGKMVEPSPEWTTTTNSPEDETEYTVIDPPPYPSGPVVIQPSPQKIEPIALWPSAPGTLVHERPSVLIDYSNANHGYITVTHRGDPADRCKLRIIGPLGNWQHFTVPSSGAAKTYPLCYGDGYYTIEFYKSYDGKDYFRSTSLSLQVELFSPVWPWLYPNTYSDYSPDSLCVYYAKMIYAAIGTFDPEAIVREVSNFICGISYDYELAERVQTDTFWLPNPDEVLWALKTICFGYASLAAGMLRPLGIPTKICVGHTTLTQGLHAWNEVYVGGEWQILDLTFLAKGGVKIAPLLTRENYHADYCG